jgi:DNA polymerase IV
MPRPIDNRGELETVTVDLLKLVFPMEKAVRLRGLSVSGFLGDEDLGHPSLVIPAATGHLGVRGQTLLHFAR